MKKSTGSFRGGEGLPIRFDGENPVEDCLFFKH
jgi:hypothetical protein